MSNFLICTCTRTGSCPRSRVASRCSPAPASPSSCSPTPALSARQSASCPCICCTPVASTTTCGSTGDPPRCASRRNRIVPPQTRRGLPRVPPMSGSTSGCSSPAPPRTARTHSTPFRCPTGSPRWASRHCSRGRKGKCGPLDGRSYGPRRHQPCARLPTPTTGCRGTRSHLDSEGSMRCWLGTHSLLLSSFRYTTTLRRASPEQRAAGARLPWALAAGKPYEAKVCTKMSPDETRK